MSLTENDSLKREKLHGVLDRILDHGIFINGKELISFEEAIKIKINCQNCIGVSSGTGALYLALKSIGIKEGDEVIVPCLSWYSTAFAVTELGAKVLFADVDENLLLDIHSAKKLITEKTKAIIPVHFMGALCDINELKTLGLTIIEDASQAFGSKTNHQWAGTLGDIGCFSLNPMKSFGALGDAGMIITADNKIAQTMRDFRYCGMDQQKKNTGASLNFRMDALQAGFLKEELGFFEKQSNRRKNIHKKYKEELQSRCQYIDVNEEVCPYGFTLLVENRKEFQAHMKKSGIETKVQHDPLMSQLDIYKNINSHCPTGSKLAKKIINLPLYPSLKDHDVDFIIEKVLEFHEK